MGKSRPRGTPPSHRAGGSSARRATDPPLSEIASKMQQISRQIDHLPTELARAVSDEEPHPRSSASGAEVVDAGLLHRGSKSMPAQVMTIDAYPNPERPETIVVRLDGWEGSLFVNLTRDRAMLLANRLAAAVDKSVAWYGPGG